MNSPIKDIVDADFDSEVLASRSPVLLDFWAPWCGPCKALLPQLERVAKEHAGALKVLKIDVDRSPEARERFGLRGVPTLIGFRDGREVIRTTGVSAGSLGALLSAILKPAEADDAPLSFLGEPMLRDECVKVLREAGAAGDLMATRPLGDQDLDLNLPSLVLGRHFGKDYRDSLGLPNDLAALHDMLFELALDVDRGVETAVSFLEALPIGENLADRTAAVAAELLHHPEHGLASVAATVADTCRSDLQVMQRLHLERQAGGPTDSDLAWPELRATLQSCIPGAPYDQARLLDALLQYAKPLAAFSSMDLTALLSELPTTREISIERAWWTEEERSLLKTMDDDLDRMMSPFTTDQPVPEEEMSRIQLAADAYRSDFWRQHPALRERQDLLMQAMEAGSREHRAVVIGLTLEVLRTGAPHPTPWPESAGNA